MFDYSPAGVALGDQFYAATCSELDELVRRYREDTARSGADRLRRLDEFAHILARQLPSTPQVAQLVFWLVTAIDRLAEQQ